MVMNNRSDFMKVIHRNGFHAKKSDICDNCMKAIPMYYLHDNNTQHTRNRNGFLQLD